MLLSVIIHKLTKYSNPKWVEFFENKFIIHLD